MDIGWKVMIPCGLANVVVLAVCMEYGGQLARLCGLRPEVTTAVGGWIALVVAWLVIAVVDPAAISNRPRKGLGIRDWGVRR
jgi:hypothetical protein